MGQAMPMTSTVPTAERLLKIRGGNVLRGEVLISGAKNAALKAMAATLLTSDEVVLNNVPMLADVVSTCELLEAFGAEVEVVPEEWAGFRGHRSGSVASRWRRPCR